ncbi:MAG: cytochrome P450 [Myxococcales bacterium]|nr:cytochrome P450 [Myxococcales bacterium]
MLPPGPSLPAALQTLLWIRRPIELMRFCRARYGNTFVLRIAGTGNLVVTSDPESIKQIFTGDPENLRAGEVNAVLEPIVGEHSVLTLDGARHLRHRRMLLPPFHGERMRLYGVEMMQITERDLDTWPSGSPFSLRNHTQDITLEVILRTVFGVDQAGALTELRRRLEKLLSIADSPLGVLGMIPAMRRNFPLSPWRRFLNDRASADEAIYAEISRRRRSGTEGRNDVLSLMIDAVDADGKHLEDVELRDELMTLLVAGHETTATAMCWAFERILDSPGVLDRLHQELDDATDGNPFDVAHANNLPYLDATIQEALRLRPVIPMVGRRLHAEFTLGELEIPKGWVLAPSIYLTHVNPALYPDPDAFRPERFLDKRPDPYAWLPFGGGIRRCLGMAFALYEMKIVMATILSRRRLELAQPAPVPTVRRAITFSPKHGTLVRAWGRSPKTRPRAA